MTAPYAEVTGGGVATVRAISDAMSRQGIVIHRGPLDRASFFQIAKKVGFIFHEKSIYVDAKQAFYIRRPDPIPFHSDHAHANVVAWLCEVPEKGTNCYLDAHRIYDELTASEREHLAGVRCYCPYPRDSLVDPKRPPTTTSVATITRGRKRLFWVPQAAPAAEPFAGPTPWIAVPDGVRVQRALEKFRSHIDVDPETADVTVQLKRGEAIFIDNNRFFHGRGGLPKTSPRQLYRVWINTDGWSSAKNHHLTKPSPTRADDGAVVRRTSARK